MGSSISAIRDDEDYYEYLCQFYNEKEQKLYSHHYNWILEKHNNKLEMSFDEYLNKHRKIEINNMIDNLKNDVKYLKLKIEKLKEELKLLK